MEGISSQKNVQRDTAPPKAGLAVAFKLQPRPLRHFDVFGQRAENSIKLCDRRKDVQIDIVRGTRLFDAPRQCQRSTESMEYSGSFKRFVRSQYEVYEIYRRFATAHSLLSARRPNGGNSKSSL